MSSATKRKLEEEDAAPPDHGDDEQDGCGGELAASLSDGEPDSAAPHGASSPLSHPLDVSEGKAPTLDETVVDSTIKRKSKSRKRASALTNTKTYENKFEKLRDTVATLQDDVLQVYAGNKSAIDRLRKGNFNLRVAQSWLEFCCSVHVPMPTYFSHTSLGLTQTRILAKEVSRELSLPAANGFLWLCPPAHCPPGRAPLKPDSPVQNQENADEDD